MKNVLNSMVLVVMAFTLISQSTKAETSLPPKISGAYLKISTGRWETSSYGFLEHLDLRCQNIPLETLPTQQPKFKEFIHDEFVGGKMITEAAVYPQTGAVPEYSTTVFINTLFVVEGAKFVTPFFTGGLLLNNITKSSAVAVRQTSGYHIGNVVYTLEYSLSRDPRACTSK
jgi:hypothetical protein